MGRSNKLYIKFLFPNILSAFPSALMFSKGPCQSIGTVMRKDTQKLNYHGRYFVFKMGKVIRINYWPVEPAVYFYSHRLSDYWSNWSKVLIR